MIMKITIPTDGQFYQDSGKAVNVKWFYVCGNRWIYTWIPKSLIEYRDNNEITIPFWFYKKIKK